MVGTSQAILSGVNFVLFFTQVSHIQVQTSSFLNHYVVFVVDLCCLCYVRMPQMILSIEHDNSVSCLKVTYLFMCLLILLVAFEVISHYQVKS